MDASLGESKIGEILRAAAQQGRHDPEISKRNYGQTAGHILDQVIASIDANKPAKGREWSDQLRLARAAVHATLELDHSIEFWPAASSVGCDASDGNRRHQEASECDPEEPQSAEPPRIFGFLHIATAHDWREIVGEQLEKLTGSKLLDKTERLFISLVGPEADRFVSDDPKFEVIYRSPDIGEYEFPTLRRLYDFSQTHDAAVYYLHTKGVFSGQVVSTVADWRRLMEYFLIERHEECLAALADFDAVGVNWHFRPWPHFSGNMWWAKAAYLRTLPDPRIDNCRHLERRMAEQWIGMNPSARVASLHQSLVNHYEAHYPESAYKSSGPPVLPGSLELKPGTRIKLRCPETVGDAFPVSLVICLGVENLRTVASIARALPNAKVLAARRNDEFSSATRTTASDPLLDELAELSNVRLIEHSSEAAATELNHPIDLLYQSVSDNAEKAIDSLSPWLPKLRPGGCVIVAGLDADSCALAGILGGFIRKQLREEERSGLSLWYKPCRALQATSFPDHSAPAGCLLSVLIPTLPNRKQQFDRLHDTLAAQFARDNLEGKVEILAFLDQKEHTVGLKRNVLMSRAVGRFVAFIDDDDEVDDRYLSLICQAIAKHPDVDCIGFTGELCSLGLPPQPTIYSLKYPRAEDRVVAEGYHVYLRPPQHLTPMRREIAVQFPFPDINCGEDYVRSHELAQAGVLRKELFIGRRIMYRYCFDAHRSETQVTATRGRSRSTYGDP